MTLFILLVLVNISAFKVDSASMRFIKNKVYDSVNGSLDGTAKFPVPYIVSIQSTIKNGHEHLCAGTIIDEHFVLTAAHCFHKVNNPAKLSITAGSNILTTKKGNRYRVLKIIKHQDFVPLLGPDIALLKLEPSFKFIDKKIGKINFKANGLFNETDAYMIGWGRVKKNLYPKLELISFSTINSNTCRNKGFIYVKNTEICAISYKGKGACDGDSGGPLVNTKFNMQIGILSYGRKPCMKGKIYAFTKISSLEDWILENIRKFT